MIITYKRALLCVASAAFLLSIALPAKAANNQDILTAIKKGVGWLYTRQTPAGNFEMVPTDPKSGDRSFAAGGQWGGLTSLTVYALLSAGESPKKNAKLGLAGDWLKEHEFAGTYAESLRAMGWQKYPDNQGGGYHAAALRDAKLIVNALKLTGAPAGLTGYFTDTHLGTAFNDEWGDHSSSLYDVLAAHALSEMGIEIPDEYWRRVDERWRKDQGSDGGWHYTDWNYPPPVPSWLAPSMNMTASGVAVLFICQEHLNLGAGCNGTINDRQIESGLSWMDAHYEDMLATSGHGEFGLQNYAAYAVERVGLLSGRKYFADTRDWYKDGSDMILKNQGGDGGWQNIPDTCFAVLFLHHGLAPVVMNKLKYDGEWNERRSDVMHVAQFMSDALEREITWQSVTLKVPTAELHESPILYIAGKGDLHFTQEEMDKLKSFIEEGGTLLGNADCGDAAFAKSFEKLGTTLFPDFEWEKLSAGHPILADQQFKAKNWHAKPDLRGLSNGVRELMLLAPASDPSKSWQQAAQVGGREAFELAANIFSYCVDRDQYWMRGETYVVPGSGGGGANRVALLKYNGYWNPEPGGWRQLSNIMATKGGGGCDAQGVELGKGQLTGYQVAHLTGVGKFKLNDAQKADLKNFVTGGGTLIMDAAGGTDGFTISARDLLQELFPDGTLAEVPQDGGVYSGVDPATMLRAAARRQFAGQGEPRGQIMALTLAGRTAVYLSPQDLTEGLVGQPVAGINGFTPTASAIIMSNMIAGH
jgi:hypothetical protein